MALEHGHNLRLQGSSGGRGGDCRANGSVRIWGGESQGASGGHVDNDKQVWRSGNVFGGRDGKADGDK